MFVYLLLEKKKILLVLPCRLCRTVSNRLISFSFDSFTSSGQDVMFEIDEDDSGGC
jgi:hypothetical protein